MEYNFRAVSYTHLDVYKRQLLKKVKDSPPAIGTTRNMKEMR